MCENGKKKVRPLPPVVAELVRQKGWSWPLSEVDKRQIHEALERLEGSLTVPEELQAEVYEGLRGFENYARRTKNVP
jgi:hypothetical protein